MSVIEIVVLAVIQGLTEFLPISSSAHLLLPSQVLGWQDQGLAFDVAVHVGTLLAVVLYFRKDIVSLLAGWFHSFGASGKSSKESRLTWCIVVATIPFVLLAPLLKDIVELYLRSAWVIATSTIVFGLLLWYADVKAKQIKDEFALTWKSALILGLAQITAVIPGTSRSGITITAGLLLGLDKKSAARFSFLMSIPVISMMGLYYTLELAVGDEVVDWNALISGVVLSFISAYACIFFFLKIIERMGMMPFVIYRLILGIGLIAYLSWAS